MLSVEKYSGLHLINQFNQNLTRKIKINPKPNLKDKKYFKSTRPAVNKNSSTRHGPTRWSSWDRVKSDYPTRIGTVSQIQLILVRSSTANVFCNVLTVILLTKMFAIIGKKKCTDRHKW